MHSFTDTITALATAAGHSAIAIIRISGKNAITIADTYFQSTKGKNKKLSKAKSHSIHFGTFTDENGNAIDDVVLLLYRNPASYTGEDSIEICCHGNPQLIERIMGVLLKKCRMAEPGEFTHRAYMNGKLDLNQAEAVNDLILAKTSKAEDIAYKQLKGSLSGFLKELLHKITQLRIKLELMIDFADQDLPQIASHDLRKELDFIRKDMLRLMSDASYGMYVREGIKVCLIGEPNTGKSSIFNAFLKNQRAIVTPHPGTTRDYLEEVISLSGYSVILYDTAGIRFTENEIEIIGIEQARELASQSDVVLYVFDADKIEENTALRFPEFETRILYIANKIDLAGFDTMPTDSEWRKLIASRANFRDLNDDMIDVLSNMIPCSTVFPTGLSFLKKAILSKCMLPLKLPERPLITNMRQANALRKSLVSINKALDALDADSGYEFIAFDLIEASSALEEILGIVSPDEVLNQIFAGFCIGK